MVNLTVTLPALFISITGYLLLKLRLVKDLDWAEARPVALTSAIAGEVGMIFLILFKEPIRATPVVMEIIFLLLYLPANVCFARKYGSLLQDVYTTTFNGNKPLAFPLGISDVFLSVIVFVIVFLGNSDPPENVLIGILGLMFLSAILGIFWAEKKFFAEWSNNLTMAPDGKVISCLSEEQAVQDPKGGCFTLGFLLIADRLGIGVSYFGLPILLVLTTSQPSLILITSAFVCLTGAVLPRLYFDVNKRRVAQIFKHNHEKSLSRVANDSQSTR